MQEASAGTSTWRGNHSNNTNWSSLANWSTPVQISNGSGVGVAAGDSLVFQGSNRPSNNNDTTAGTSYAGITFASGGAAFTLNGNSIKLTGSVTNSSTQLQNINLAMTLDATRAINTASGNITINSVISGNGNITKTGTEHLVLTNTNTYTGATLVTAGSLWINGTNSGSGAVNVESGAVLGGSGSVIGALNLSGTLSPGSSNRSIQSLRGGVLSFSGNSTYAYELQTNGEFSGDLAHSSGNLNIATGTILTLTDLSTTTVLTQGSKLTLVSSVGAWNGGFFSYNSGTGLVTLGNESEIVFGLNKWKLKYNDTERGINFGTDTTGASNFVTMTVVPEPNVAAVLGGIGTLLLLRRRRAQ